MLGVRSAAVCDPFFCFPLAATAFQHASGQCSQQILRTCTLPEQETRNGLSLARNDAFATITRSTLPTCAFASAPKNPANPFDRRLLRSVRSSKPSPGELIAIGPLSAPISVALVISFGLHSPSGPFGTFRIKAFDRLHTRSSPGPDVWLSLAPRGALFRFRPGSTLETPLPSCPAIVP
jgi:hypothetical protein